MLTTRIGLCSSRQMFFCISLGFIVAWAPYTIVSLLSIFSAEGSRMAPVGFVFPALFAKSSHVYNPVIYFFFNKVFRQELRGLLRAVWPPRGRGRVGVPPPAPPPPPHPIQIQLQEQGLRRPAPRTSSLGGGWRPHSLAVDSCWATRTGPNRPHSDPPPPREFLPVST